MSLPPNISNYTVPGGVKLFFNAGAGEYDLGNIKEVSLVPGTEDLEHFSNRSGRRRKDHALVSQESLTIEAIIDEPVVENWKRFFRGDAITAQGTAGATATDVEATLTGLVHSSLGAYYGISGLTVRSFIDYCYLYDGVSVYTDNSVEADSLAGTAFAGMADAGDKLYFGKITPFAQLYFDVDTPGSYGARTWEYWNGSAWTSFVPTGAGEDFTTDGKVILGSLATWTTTTVNGVSAYWVRVSVASVTTPVTIKTVRQNFAVNVDYVFNPGQHDNDGRIAATVGRLAAAAIADGEAVRATFTYSTWTSQVFNMTMGGYAQGSCRLEVHPEAGRGLSFDLEFPKVQIKPNGNLALNDQEWLGLPITIEVLDDYINTPTYPMGRFISYET
jgi:hypothetical protein